MQPPLRSPLCLVVLTLLSPPSRVLSIGWLGRQLKPLLQARLATALSQLKPSSISPVTPKSWEVANAQAMGAEEQDLQEGPPSLLHPHASLRACLILGEAEKKSSNPQPRGPSCCPSVT